MRLKLIAMLVLLLTVEQCIAARVDIKADIGQIRYHEATNTMGAPYQKTVWFALANPDVASSCPKFDSNILVIFPDTDQAALSMILMAKAANKRVWVTLDDSALMLGYCKLQYLTLL